MPDDTHDACEQLQLDDARLRLETGLTQYGGGRGVFTTVAFQPGDVVMRETPFHVGPDGVAEGDVNLHAALARSILQDPRRDELLRPCGHLCPVRLRDVPPEALAVLRHAHTSTLERLREVEAAREGALGDDALLRLVLAMQMNAFRSGVYLRLAMVNHAGDPNCVKLTPSHGSYSEIVATRPIAANEEVLIDYLHPKGQSHARRKVAFEEQHVWELAEGPPCGGGGASAPESDALAPGQPRHGEAGFEAAMARVGELENDLEQCAQRLEQGARPRDVAESVSKLCEQAEALLGGGHIVWYRVRQLQIDALHHLASRGEASTQDLVALVRVCRRHLVHQTEVLGAQHCDVAATLDLLQSTMEHLMATDRKALSQAFPEEWPTFAKVSKAHYAYQQQFKKLRALYASEPDG